MIKIWDLAQDGKAVRTFGCPEGTSCVGIEFHPLVDILATMASNSTITLWDFRQRRCIKQIVLQDTLSIEANPWINPSLQFSPDGKWFCYSSISNDESFLHVWDLSSGKEIQRLSHPVNEELICELIFHPHHMIMITGTKKGNIRVWDMTTFRLLHVYEPLKDFLEQNIFSDGIRMMFNQEGNILFGYKGAYMERISWNESKLERIDILKSECKHIPSHLLLSGSSLLSLCCDTPSSFSLWLTNTTYNPVTPIDAKIPSSKAQPLSDQTNIIPSKESTTTTITKENSNITQKEEKKVQLQLQPPNQRISIDRKNSEYALDITSFCNNILKSDNQVSEDKLIVELSGDKHKQFCSTIQGRMKVLKPLSNFIKREDIQFTSILNLFSRCKDIDLATLSVAISTCTSYLEKISQPPSLQVDNFVTLNSLFLLLLESETCGYIDIALQCLNQVVSHYAPIIRANRPNRLRDSLQYAQQISQDTNALLSLRIIARSACRSYTEKASQ